MERKDETEFFEDGNEYYMKKRNKKNAFTC